MAGGQQREQLVVLGSLLLHHGIARPCKLSVSCGSEPWVPCSSYLVGKRSYVLSFPQEDIRRSLLFINDKMLKELILFRRLASQLSKSHGLGVCFSSSAAISLAQSFNDYFISLSFLGLPASMTSSADLPPPEPAWMLQNKPHSG